MDDTSEPRLDLDAYLARIGHDGKGPLAPTLGVLEALHLGHATHIPFENLDILLGRPIRLDLESLQAKLVEGRRGGYCFEQNMLFAAVLERVGFRVTPLAARVRFGSHEIRPRTHMLLRVDVEGTPYLADVGFGGETLMKPLHLSPRHEVRIFDRTYRLLEDADLWVLQAHLGEGWLDLYAFTMEPQYPVDYEMASYFTSTHPTSIFVQQAFAQRTSPEASYLLLDHKLSVRRGAEVVSRTLESDEERLRVLAETFGLEFPPGTRFQPGAP